MIERPAGLDPAPQWVLDWLHERNDQGVSMLELRLAQLIEENDPTTHVDLLANELTFTAEGPDAEGVFSVEIMRTTTGEAVSRLEAHWRALLSD